MSPVKSQKVERLFQAHPDWTPRQIAAKAKCSYGYAVFLVQVATLRKLYAMPTPPAVLAAKVSIEFCAQMDRLQAGETGSLFARWLINVSGLPELLGGFSSEHFRSLKEKAAALLNRCAEKQPEAKKIVVSVPSVLPPDYKPGAQDELRDLRGEVLRLEASLKRAKGKPQRRKSGVW